MQIFGSAEKGGSQSKRLAFRSGRSFRGRLCFSEIALTSTVRSSRPGYESGRRDDGGILQVHLGLFDTPPSRRQTLLAAAAVGLLCLSSAILFPVRDVRWIQIDAYIPILNAIMFVADLITATLLYAQAGVFRSRALSVLSTGFLISGLLLVPHTLTFPGAFSPSGLLGAGLGTTYWIAVTRRLTYPISILLYVRLRHAEAVAGHGPEQPAPRIILGVITAFAVTAAVTVLTTAGHDLLPPVFSNKTQVIRGYFVGYEAVIFAICVIATIMLLRKRRSVLDVWLLVGSWGWLIHTLINLSISGRFTIGFYWVFGLLLFSHLVVLLALIAESNRLYARLAVATTGWDREREARLMSIDALAASISHEVGQPLSAAIMSAESSQRALERQPPDLEKANKSLRATIDAGRLTFDVIKSIRSTLAKRPGARTEFCLNDLVRATVSSLERELDGEDVSVQFALDETLPPILADRTQIARVLANLVTNAIESLSTTRGRRRRIVLRSSSPGAKRVHLQISDNGMGIPPDQLERIFEIFFTTKATGSGLGLSLCRTIVEAHGGRLWASQGDDQGATFHLELPSGFAST